MFKMYNVCIGATPTDEQAKRINEVVNKSKTWLRYGPSSWLVWDSNHTAKEWLFLLRPIIPEADLLVSSFSGDSNDSYGSFSQEIWNWITATTGSVPEPSD
jgi:hypothetical protein